jgi:hypothetical protein
MKGSVCPTCNHSTIPGSAYCDNCGRRLIKLPAAQPQAAAAGAQAAPLPPPTGRFCPQCSFNNIPGALFCIDCGEPLRFLPTPDDSPATELTPSPDSAPPPPPYTAFITGSLVLEQSNVLLPLPKERIEITIGREDPVSSIFPDIDLEPHGGHDAGVGRQHARLVIIEGRLCLVDLNSTNSTFVNRRKIPAGTPQPVNDGDEIRLGRFVLRYQAS